VSAEIRELTELREFDELGRLLADIWGPPAEPPLNSDLLRAMAHSGCYIAGAFAGGRMVGGLVGWLGGRPPDGVLMHSHILGVLPGDQARGLGFELKQHQRRWCLERGVRVMEWTTDPLVRRNAYFNLAKLGAEAPEYLVNFYGEMRDGINAGDESDRLLIRWRLDSQRALAAAAGELAELDVEKLRSWDTPALVVVGDGGEPVETDAEARVLICQVPDDIVAIRRNDAAMARRWRLAVRRALAGALGRGYVIAGATRSGWYVLESRTQ
jgi:predicted GNAT superfamily acetyltransferase